MNLRAYRASLGLGQADFAPILKIHQGTISKIENQAIMVSLALALDIETRTSGKVPAESLPMTTASKRVLRRHRRAIAALGRANEKNAAGAIL